MRIPALDGIHADDLRVSTHAGGTPGVPDPSRHPTQPEPQLPSLRAMPGIVATEQA